MKRVIALDESELLKGDPKLFAARPAYDHRDLEKELPLIELTQKQMARILRALTPADFQRRGGHSGEIMAAAPPGDNITAGVAADVPGSVHLGRAGSIIPVGERHGACRAISPDWWPGSPPH
jgi:hypothetical protein